MRRRGGISIGKEEAVGKVPDGPQVFNGETQEEDVTVPDVLHFDLRAKFLTRTRMMCLNVLFFSCGMRQDKERGWEA
jgi:hypothetical protein